MTTKMFGAPSTSRAHMYSADQLTPFDVGGIVEMHAAKVALNIGDFVYFGHDLTVTKSLGSSYYQARFAGVVVGGKLTDDDVVFDPGAIGVAAAAAADRVLIMRRGVCWCVADATGILKGNAVTAGRTTAGRVIGDMKSSFARTVAGLAIKAGASAIVKAVNVTQTQVAGVQGTATAANLDQAALAGTVVNLTHNVWEFRIAADGTTVTSAFGTAGATRDAIVFPTGSATLATLGYVFINPTGTGNFVGGTTALDDATVVPNAVYVDLVGVGKPLGWALQDGGAAASAVLVFIDI